MKRRPISSLDEGGPDESGQFAGDRGDDLLGGLPARGESVLAPIQALLRGPGVRDDRGRRARLPAPERVAHKAPVTIMPRRFDQDAAQMRIPRFGDRAAGLFRPSGMFGGHEADKRHRARRRAKSARVAEFGGDGERREVVDPAKTPEAFDAGPERLERQQAAQILFDGAEARHGFVDRAQIRAVRLIERRQRPCLRSEPGRVWLGPRLGHGEAAPVTEQEFREPMSRAQEIGPDVFATPKEIARGFFLVARNVNGGQGAGAIQDRQLTGIAPVRFDAITRTPRNQTGRDDVAVDLTAAQESLQLEAARTRLVAAAHRALARELRHEPSDRGQIGTQRLQRRRSLPRQEYRRHDRRSMLIEGHDDCRLVHDRPPLFAALLRAVAG